MEAISGVFKTRSRGENAVNEALKAGIPADRITLLTPGAVDQLNKENLQLEEEVKELKTDPHKIEKIARDELGLARPGEVIIEIPRAQQLPQDSTVKP